jgi:hypothetical protein
MSSHLDLAFDVLRVIQRAAHTQSRSLTGRDREQAKRFFVNLEYQIQRILDTLAHLPASNDVNKVLHKILRRFEGLFEASRGSRPVILCQPHPFSSLLQCIVLTIPPQQHQLADNSYPNLERLRNSTHRDSPRRCGLHRFLQGGSPRKGRINKSLGAFRESFILKISHYNQSLAVLVPRTSLERVQHDSVVLWPDGDVADTTWELRSPDKILRQANHLYNALSRHWHQDVLCSGPGVAQLRLSCMKNNESSYDMMFSACSGHSQSDGLEADAEVIILQST